MKLCWQELARIVLNVCSEFSGLQIEFILFVSYSNFCCMLRFSWYMCLCVITIVMCHWVTSCAHVECSLMLHMSKKAFWVITIVMCHWVVSFALCFSCCLCQPRLFALLLSHSVLLSGVFCTLLFLLFVSALIVWVTTVIPCQRVWLSHFAYVFLAMRVI